MSVLTPDGFTDLFVKATLVLGLAGVTAIALRRGSAATRHLVWTLAVATALVLPALRGLAPRWALPVLPAMPTVVQIGPADAGLEPVAQRDARRAPLARIASPPQPRALAVASEPPHSAPGFDSAKLLGALWLAGALLVAAPLVVGTLRISIYRRRRGTFASPDWARLLRDIASSLGLRRAVRLLRGRPSSMPMAWGLLRPAVVLPEDAEAWPAERRRAVLTHELGHVKRHDCLTQALAQAACALFWFHPLVWVAAWRLRVERERACDDLVLQAGASGADYADHLLQLARGARAGAGPAWALAMARPSQLEGRLLAILDPSQERRGPSRALTASTVAAAALGALLLAGLQPWTQPVVASTTLAENTLGADGIGSTQAAAPQPEQPAVRLALSTPQPTRPQPEQPEQEAQGRQPRRSPAASEAVVAALADAVRDQDKDVRRQAIASLGELRVDAAAPALAGALRDEDAEVRAQAAFALGELRTTMAVEALGQALASDSEAEVRQQAAFALGQIRAESAIPALSAALADKDADVRRQAVFALGELRAQSAVDGLTKALKDSDDEVRQQAAFALGEIRAESAVAPLTTALKDSQADVRKQAAFALGEIRSPQAVPALIDALKDASPEVREQAAFALGEIGDARASEPLMRALKDATTDVRRQAAFALGQLAGDGGNPNPNPNANPNPNPNSNPNPNPNPNPRP